MKKIVTIGGGTGSYTVLSGLKNLPDVSITALVSMADDGGSTGVLMDELGILPPGDIRQCLTALSDHTKIVRELMNYRFSRGTLSGHSFGNIFLAALEKVTGEFMQAVEIASEILKVRGSVLPITSNKARLLIKLNNGKIIEGENKINHSDIQNAGIKKVFYKDNVVLNKKAKKAILEADYIIIGPGNYYSSIIPNLIVRGFKGTFRKSKAKIILPINLTNKHGHTLNWKSEDYLLDLEKYLGKKVNYILINNEKPPKGQIEKYSLQEGGGVLVENNLHDARVIQGSFLSNKIGHYGKSDVIKNTRSFIRHDSKKLATTIHKLIQRQN